jgi:hypothetical protein
MEETQGLVYRLREENGRRLDLVFAQVRGHMEKSPLITG